MDFTLNGGPFDGVVIKHLTTEHTGKSVLVVKTLDGKPYFYVCPSQDDFDSRDLWLCTDPEVLSKLRSELSHRYADLNTQLNNGSYWNNTSKATTGKHTYDNEHLPY